MHLTSHKEKRTICNPFNKLFKKINSKFGSLNSHKSTTSYKKSTSEHSPRPNSHYVSKESLDNVPKHNRSKLRIKWKQKKYKHNHKKTTDESIDDHDTKIPTRWNESDMGKNYKSEYKEMSKVNWNNKNMRLSIGSDDNDDSDHRMYGRGNSSEWRIQGKRLSNRSNEDVKALHNIEKQLGKRTKVTVENKSNPVEEWNNFKNIEEVFRLLIYREADSVANMKDSSNERKSKDIPRVRGILRYSGMSSGALNKDKRLSAGKNSEVSCKNKRLSDREMSLGDPSKGVNDGVKGSGFSSKAEMVRDSGISSGVSSKKKRLSESGRSSIKNNNFPKENNSTIEFHNQDERISRGGRNSGISNKDRRLGFNKRNSVIQNRIKTDSDGELENEDKILSNKEERDKKSVQNITKTNKGLVDEWGNNTTLSLSLGKVKNHDSEKEDNPIREWRNKNSSVYLATEGNKRKAQDSLGYYIYIPLTSHNVKHLSPQGTNGIPKSSTESSSIKLKSAEKNLSLQPKVKETKTEESSNLSTIKPSKEDAAKNNKESSGESGGDDSSEETISEESSVSSNEKSKEDTAKNNNNKSSKESKNNESLDDLLASMRERHIVENFDMFGIRK